MLAQTLSIIIYTKHQPVHAAAEEDPAEVLAILVTVLQVTKKSSHEKFPSTARYSDRSRAEDASHTVSLDTEFRCISNPDEVVAPEDRVKAYKVIKEWSMLLNVQVIQSDTS